MKIRGYYRFIQESTIARTNILVIALAVLTLAVDFGDTPALAAEATGYKTMEPDASYQALDVRGVSADGRVVIGWSTTPDGERAFAWTAGSPNIRPLGDLSAAALATNMDGQIIVGIAEAGTSMRPFLWKEASQTMHIIDVGTAGYSYASGVSADGTVVAGSTETIDGYRPFRWSETTGMTLLDPLLAGEAQAGAISADGGSIVGWTRSAVAVGAFRWREATGMQSLGTLPGGIHSSASAVSANGDVVVGTATTADGYRRAFRWTETAGMADIGVLPGGTNSNANGVNADGSVIVGFSSRVSGDHGFRWSEATGMISIEEWLRNSGVTIADDFVRDAKGVSGDGNVIVGNTVSGGIFLARIVPPEQTRPAPATDENSEPVANPSTTTDNGVAPTQTDTGTDSSATAGMNTTGAGISPPTPATSTTNQSTASGADETVATSPAPAVAESGIIDLTQYAHSLAGLPLVQHGLDITGTILNGAHGDPMRNLLTPGQHSLMVTSDTGYDNGSSSRGGIFASDITYAQGFEGDITARFAAGGLYNRQDLEAGGHFNQTGFYIAPEVTASVAGPIHATFGAFYAPQHLSIQRGYRNGDVMDYSRGKTDVENWGAKFRLDWKDAFTLSDAVVTPYASLTWVKARMEAYFESGGSFPASFDAISDQATVMRVGLDGVVPLSGQSRLLTRAEVAYRFEDKSAPITGDMIGLSGFRFEGQDIDQFWLRGGFGAEVDIAGGTASLTLNATTKGDDPTVWVKSAWKVVF
ncbi:autotransporter domain-containing protein [Agrobacterium sp. 22-211-1]|uniref:autotransporter domain-containing protein n=1 Tax=Agrobacterium tomkonis TaxID=1183410 RepID=UPI001CD91A4C|nr:autotransporter domain-containing protein [Agrobacterium tomkonis RTP8]